jgi:hypothetical protein
MLTANWWIGLSSPVFRELVMAHAKPESASNKTNEAARNAAVHKLIAERAYELWENHGRPHGYDLYDWLEAEQEINGCLEYGSVPGGEPTRI